MIFFLIKNYKLVFKLAKFDFEILNFFFYSSFLVIQNIERLNKLKNLKLVLVGHDLPFPVEISTACKRKNIKTIAIQDRVASAAVNPLMIFDYYFVCGERSKNFIKKRMPSPFIENLLNLYIVKTDKYDKLNNSNGLENNFSNYKLKCLVIDLHSERSWYDNGRCANNWRINKDFYHEIINLAEHFPQVEFLMKSKDYSWLDIPYFKEILNKLYQKKNIRILSNQEKWTPVRSVNACDFAIALYSSLSDEMLALGKPVIMIDKFGDPEKYFNFGKIIVKNWKEETIKKINLIVTDYKKYNLQIEEDRNKIYYKNQPGKLNIELNKIFLAQKNH